MFYHQPPEQTLRFGDVIVGFVSSTPVIKKPLIDIALHDYHVEVHLPPFCVVFSPCCSIGEQMISLVPLKHLPSNYFDNPYFAADMTNINRMMESRNTLSPSVWEGMPEDEKERRLSVGRTYAFMSIFVYAEAQDLLPKYELKVKKNVVETGFYLVDFRDIFKVSCQSIISATKSPFEAKILQLSIKARKELREKISYYYSRVPQEDAILLDEE